MWGTLVILILLLALLALVILGARLGQTFWYSQVLMALWISYFIAICLVFLYREQVHNAKAGSIFKLHDALLAQHDTKDGDDHTSAAAAVGSSLADEDNLL